MKQTEKNNRLPEVIELIQEEPGNSTIEKFLGNLPKSKNKLQGFYDRLMEHLQGELIAEKELEAKRKKAQDIINNMEPVKALKRLKKELKDKKQKNEKMIQALMGVKSTAKVMGIDLKSHKPIQLGE